MWQKFAFLAREKKTNKSAAMCT